MPTTNENGLVTVHRDEHCVNCKKPLERMLQHATYSNEKLAATNGRTRIYQKEEKCTNCGTKYVSFSSSNYQELHPQEPDGLHRKRLDAMQSITKGRHHS